MQSSAQLGRCTPHVRPLRSTATIVAGALGPSQPMTDTPPLVLIVEDFDDAREMYLEYLSFSGLRAAGAPDAIAGLRLAAELQPSIILMDAALPGLSGWDAIVELKANPATQHIPVVMLTGHVLGDARARALAAGAVGFIAKPCLPDELVKRVLETLQAR